MEITKQELKRKYETMSVADIARELGVSRQTVYSYLKEANVPIMGRKIAVRKSLKKVYLIDE